MFQNGFFGLFKTSQEQQEEPRSQQWNPTTMAMEQPANYAGNHESTTTSQEEQQMKLRGGEGCCDVCCGCCAGLIAFECCEECC